MSKVFIRSVSSRALFHLLAVLSISLIATLFAAIQLAAAQAATDGPSVRSFSGPNELKVGEEGLWKVTTTDQDEGPITYRVRWGDESVASKISDAAFSLFANPMTLCKEPPSLTFTARVVTTKSQSLFVTRVVIRPKQPLLYESMKRSSKKQSFPSIQSLVKPRWR